MSNDKHTDDELFKSLAGWNESAPQRHKAAFELNVRAAQRGGAKTLFWTRVAAAAAIVGAILAAIAAFR
jgi:hypothetical protein